MAEIPFYEQSPTDASILPPAADPALAASAAAQTEATVAAHQAAPLPTANVQVFDHVHKSAIEIPETKLELAIKTGRYTLPNDYKLPIVTPDGKFGTIGATEAYEAIQSGYKVQTPEQQHEIKMESQYGDSEMSSAALGAASGLTFGISSQLLDKTGMLPGDVQHEITSRSPDANMAGEIGGIALGLLGPGAIGRVGGAAVRGVEAVGALTERAVAKQLTKQAVKAGVSNPAALALAKKLIPKAAGGAVEGTFYGTGQLLKEDALGDANFNAENLVAAAGAGALLGGALGAGIGAASAAMPAVKSATSFITKPIGTAFEGLVDRNKAAMELFGMTPAKVANASQDLKENVADFLKDRVGLKATDTAEKLFTKVEDLKTSAGNTIDSVLKQSEAAGVKAESKIFTDLADKIETEIVGQYKGTPGFEGTVKQVENYAAEVRTLAAKNPEFGALQLQKLRKQTDELINYGKRTGDMPLVQQAAYTVRRELRSTIDNIATQVKPELGAQLKQANRDFHLISEVSDNLEKKVAKEQFVKFSDVILGGVGLSAGGPAGLAGAAAVKFAQSDVRRKLVVLSSIERAQQKMSSTIKRAVDGFFKPLGRVAEPVAINSLMSTDLAADFSHSRKRVPKTKQEAFQNISRNLEMYAGSPETLLAHSNKATSLMYDAAPKTAGATDMVTSNAINFLNSKLPRKNQNAGLITALRGPSMPSTIGMAKFERYVHAVENPGDVIKAFHSGHMTKEGVEALKNVYPSIHKQLIDEVTGKLNKDIIKMPYNKKLNLGLLLGIPTDESMIPQNILGLQKSIAGADAAGAETPETNTGAVNSTVGGLKELNTSGRLQTGNEKILSRNEG